MPAVLTFEFDASSQQRAKCFRLAGEKGRIGRLVMGFPLSGRTLSVEREQPPLGDHQIGQGKQREELGGVLGQSPVAVLFVPEQVLDEVERMLDLGADAGLEPLNALVQSAQFVVRQRTALAGPQGDEPLHRAALILFPLLNALVAGIAKGHALCAMQQLMGLRHVIDVGGRGHQRMHEAGLRIDADVCLNAEMPLVALLGLMHLGISPLALVLGRTGRGDDRGVHDRTFLKQQALVGQMDVDCREDALGQLVLFQQATELQKGRRIRRRFPGQVDADKASDRLAVVDGVLDSLVGQPEALLGDVHAQHPLQADRRTAASFALGIERLDRRDQRRPRRHRLDLGQKAVATRHLLLRRVLQVGKASLHARFSFNSVRIDYPKTIASDQSLRNKSVCP